MSKGLAILIAIVIIAVVVGVIFTLKTRVKKVKVKAKGTLEGKRVLVVVFEHYQPKELKPVLETLSEYKAEVKILAVNKTVNIPYDYYILDIKDKFELIAKEYDAIVLIGEPGVYCRVINRIKDPGLPLLEELCRKFYAEGKLVVAIRAAPGVLARADILKGVKATCFPDTKLISLLKEHGAVYVKQPVVVHGNIITSEGPRTAKEYAEAIVEYLLRH